jgi:hypothetical protein
MIDVALLVSYFLVPYLKHGAEELANRVAESAGEGAGKQVASTAGKIWARVRSAFSSDRDRALLEEFKDKPDEATPLVEARLREKLEADEELRRDLEEIVSARATATGDNALSIVQQADVANVLVVRDTDLRYSKNAQIASTITNAPGRPAADPAPGGSREAK